MAEQTSYPPVISAAGLEAFLAGLEAVVEAGQELAAHPSRAAFLHLEATIAQALAIWAAATGEPSPTRGELRAWVKAQEKARSAPAADPN